MLKNIPNCVTTFLDVYVVFPSMRLNMQDLIARPDHPIRDPLDIQFLARCDNIIPPDYVRPT